jgi:DUF4097 and DUF4098 domain-containing protein YvlB
MAIRSFPGETLQKEFNAAKGKCLDVDLRVGGSINITGWEKEKVAVTVLFKKTTPDQWDIRFKETVEGIEIEAAYKGGERDNISSPDFEIRTPSQFDLKLKTMGGAININGVTGEITGRTMGGPLELVNLKGTIELKTMGGDISLKDSDIDGKLKTMGGRVLFENVIGDVSGSSMGGNVIYNNVKPRETRDAPGLDDEATGKSGKIVKISTMGGDINVSDAPDGADVHTMGGNIHIKSAGDFVKAKTMGGSIVVDAIDGGINATTMGGNITAVMIGDPQKGDRDVKLNSMAGDITLTVPENLSMDVDIELIYTKDAKKNYDIVSDFQLKKEKPDTWDESKSSPRKTIRGKAQIAGGKYKIKISTINGNIYLKKLKMEK